MLFCCADIIFAWNKNIYPKMKRLILNFLWLLGLCPLVAWAKTEQAVSLETPTGTINGKLLIPDVERPPVVLLIAGSGPTDMDGNTVSGAVSIKNNSLKFLAEGLARQGIATLRYDKRGIASSASAGKSEQDLRFDDYVADASGWIDWLNRENRFSSIYVLGHSEGSLIGMIACTDNRAVKGFVSLAGAGRPAYALIEEQMAGQPAEVRVLVKSFNDSLRAGRTISNVPMGLMALFRPSVQPYLISWYRYDPCEILSGLKLPVLIVQGDRDIQVPVADAERLKQALPAARFFIVENMNHVLKPCESTDLATQQAIYANPDLPVSEELITAIEKFIKQ